MTGFKRVLWMTVGVGLVLMVGCENPTNDGDSSDPGFTADVVPHGITFDGEFLWLVDRKAKEIVRVNQDGAELKRIPYPGSSPTGLTWDGENLWVGDDVDLTIRQIDPSDGALMSEIDAPGGDCTGLGWDGQHLWNADFSEGGRLHQLDPDGNVEKTIALPGDGPEGVTWDGSSIIVSDFDTSDLYAVNPSSEAITEGNTVLSKPIGLTWDGENLWIISEATAEVRTGSIPQ